MVYAYQDEGKLPLRRSMSPDVALGVSYTSMVIAVFVVGCRWYYHIKRINKYGIVSEIWMGFGVLALIALQVVITMLFKNNDFLYDLSTNGSWFPERLEVAASWLYAIGIFFVKFAIAHFFRNIAHGKTRWLGLGLIIFLLPCMVGTMVVNAFRGGDSTKTWSEDLDLGYGGGTALASASISIIVTYALHTITYLYIFVNYFVLVLRFKPRNRNESISVFVAWFFAALIIIFSTWRFASAFVRRDIIAFYYWSSYEFSIVTMYAALISTGGPLFGITPEERQSRRRNRKSQDQLIEDGVAQ